MRNIGRHYRIYLVPLAISLMLLVAGCNNGKPDAPAQNGSNETETDSTPSPDKKEGARTKFDQKHPQIKIETSLGNILLELDREKAPQTVDNFIQYVDDRFYEDSIFHDVSPGYVILGGAYTEDLSEKPTRISVRNEAENGLKNVRGAIAMARDPEAIDSAKSTFFINLADNPHMDHKDGTPGGYGYCVFGKVTEGLDVADRIGAAKTHQAPGKTAEEPPFERMPVEPVVIRSIRVVR